MQTLWKDLSYSLRMLRKSPIFTAITGLSLALGIGANSAVFSVINAVLLRPLPYREPERLVMIWEHDLKNNIAQQRVAPNNFLGWKKNNRVFEEIAAVSTLIPKTFSGAGALEQVECHQVSANFFPLLGVDAGLGRTFSQEEDMPRSAGKQEVPQGERVVVLSHDLWQRNFGGDPKVLGKTIQLDREDHTVIGVLPPAFRFMDKPADVWIPLGLDPAKDYYAAGFGRFLWAPARLKSGVTLEEARREMNFIAGQLQQQYPILNAGRGINIVPLGEQIIGNISRTLLILFGAVVFVLLIACANIANLRLAQASRREKEIAIRAALGASRPRLIRLLLMENFVLAVLGGAIGLLLAFWLVKLLIALAPDNIPRLTEINLDFRVAGFTLLFSLLAGLISGIIPAWQASKLEFNEALKEGGQSAEGGARGKLLRSIFIVAQVTIVMLLLTGAGLMIKSFLRLQATQIGFDPRNLLTMRLLLPFPAYLEMQKRTAFFEQALQQIEFIPGVKSVTAINFLPFSGERVSPFFMIEGRHSPQAVDKPRADLRIVSSNYFKTIGIPVVMGREFTKREISDTEAKVVIINETLAHRFWPNESPLGRRIIVNRADNPPDEIIGVAKDVKNLSYENEVLPTIYWPHQRFPFPSATILVRTSVDPMSLNPAVTSKIRALDPEQAIADVQTMEQVLWSSVARPRFYMLLLTIFAVIALSLAILGIYGVVSYVVTQRTHEIGLRIALGATTFNILKLVLKQGMRLTSIGILFGLGASFALTRVLKGLLYEVKATDPATFFGVALLFFAVALLACYIPARRATRVDPMITLRHE